MLAPWKESYGNHRQHIKKQRHYFANKNPGSQRYGFSSSQIWMWELDHKKAWAPNNWCIWIVVLEKTLERPLNWKEIKSVNPKGNKPWMKYWCLSWSTNTLTSWWEEPTHWKRPWFWEKLKATGDGSDRGWDGSIPSLAQRTWIWANSGK